MSRPSGVFLSTVSSEFGAVREVLAGDLRAKHHSVTVEEDFRQEDGVATTLSKLEAYIRGCEAVVCVIGRRSGSVPPPAAAAPFAAMLPEGFTEASYTQWELFFALHHGKPLFKFHATDRYVPDRPEPPPHDDAALQARFVDWVFERQGFDRTEFSTAEELRIEVLKVDLGVVSGARHVGVPTGQGLDVLETAGTRTRRRSPDEANRLKPNRHPIIGRDEELENVIDELDARHEQVVMLSGEAGIGKKALLQELTHRPDLPSDFADGSGIHPFVTTTENAEDLRQAIWEEFYETDDPSAVAPRQRLKDLSGIEALIFLPDFDESLPSLVEILDDVSDTVFCISATEEATRDMVGEEIPILGLDDDEMLAVFADRYREDVPEEARAAVIAACRASGGNPGQIELLAKEARKAARRHDEGGEHPLVTWASAHGSGGDGAPSDDVPPEQQRVVAATRAVGGEVPRAVLAQVAGSTEPIDAAVEDRQLEEGSPRYRVNPVLDRQPATDADPAAAHDEIMAELFRSATAWARDATHAEIYEDRGFVLRMLDWGLRSGWELLDRRDDPRAHVRAYDRWRRTIRLAIVTEPAMWRGGRHGAWEHLLRTVLVAARACLELADPTPVEAADDVPDLDDLRPARRAAEEALGWAHHQLGSRALIRDELGDARHHLNAALRHRGSATARALARRNLTRIPLAVVPLAVIAFGVVLVGSVVVALRAPFDDDPSTIDITPDWGAYDDTSDFACGSEPNTLCFMISNVGDGAVWIDRPVIEEVEFEEMADEQSTPTSSDDAAEGPEGGDIGTGERAPRFEIVDIGEREHDHGDGDVHVHVPCTDDMQLPEGGSCEIAVVSKEPGTSAILRIAAISRSNEPADGDSSAVLVRPPDPNADESG